MKSVILTSALIGLWSLVVYCNAPYNLFGTKTGYEPQLDAVKKSVSHDSNIFGSRSLEEEHQKLLDSSYTPVMFFQLSRHAVRNPKIEVLDNIQKTLVETLIPVLKSMEDETFREMIEWDNPLSEEPPGRITKNGFIEHDSMIQRFKSIYPDFFNVEKANIEFGITRQYRTLETAVRVMKHLDNSNLKPDQDITWMPGSPGLNVVDPSIYTTTSPKHPWFKIFSWHYMEVLKVCKRIHGGKFRKHVELGNASRLIDISSNILTRMKIPLEKFEPELRKKIVDTMFDVCRHEVAALGDSPWCSPFTKADLEVYEYKEDVEVFLEDCYGPQSRPKMACPIVKDILDRIDSSIEGCKEKCPGDRKLNTHLYITHSDSIKKVFAALELGRESRGFEAEDIQKFVYTGKPPERDWRTSLIIPFSANLSLIMYKKVNPNDNHDTKPRILTVLNERPVRLGYCSDVHCTADEFIKAYENMRNCDLDEICARAHQN